MTINRVKSSVALGGALINAGSAGVFLFLVATATNSNDLVAFTVFFFVFSSCCGICCWWWESVVSDGWEDYVLQQSRNMLKPQNRRAPPMPLEIDDIVADHVNLMTSIGHNVASAIEKQYGLRDKLKELAGHLATIEADRETLRQEAAKVQEIAAVAGRKSDVPRLQSNYGKWPTGTPGTPVDLNSWHGVPVTRELVLEDEETPQQAAVRNALEGSAP